jgi:hypothetical protein
MIDDHRLDALLGQHFAADATDDSDAAARVLAALAQPLPAQRQPWRLWPAALLDWNFAPAWPRLAALAGCAALGFALGVTSLPLHGPGATLMMAQNDSGLAAVLSEPEPLTGVVP